MKYIRKLLLLLKHKGCQFWLLQLIQTSHTFNILPFTFHQHTKLVTRSSSRKLFLWYFIYLCYTFDVIKMSLISSTVTLASVPQKEFLDFYIHFLSRLTALLFLWVICMYHEDISYLLNVLFHMDKQSRTSHRGVIPTHAHLSSSSTPSSDLPLLLIAGSTIFAHIQPIFPLILHLENRYSQRYWLARSLSRSLYNSPLIIVLYAINDLLYSYMGFFVTVLLISTLLIYITVTNFSLQLLWKTVSRHYIPIYRLNLQYRQLQIFNRIGNFGFANIVMPTLVAGGMCLLVFVTTCLVRRAHILQTVIICNFLICLFFMVSGFHALIDAGGRVWKTSNKIKFHLRYRKVNCDSTYRILKFDKTCVMSWQEIRFYMGSILYFHTATFFLFCKLTLECCVNLLLMTT